MTTENKFDIDIVQFAELARESSHEIRTRHPEGINFLKHLDGLFTKLLGEKSPIQDNSLCFLLALQGHSLYRAAILSAVSGHVAPVYPTLRTSLECFFYGVIIKKNPDLAKIWFDRNQSKTTEKKCRNTFTAKRGLEALRTWDRKLGVFATETYDSTIDFGAHPNVKGISKNLSSVENDDHEQFNFTYLHGPTFETARALVACAEIGLCGLYVLQHLLPTRGQEIGLSKKLGRLQDAFSTGLFGLHSKQEPIE